VRNARVDLLGASISVRVELACITLPVIESDNRLRLPMGNVVVARRSRPSWKVSRLMGTLMGDLGTVPRACIISAR